VTLPRSPSVEAEVTALLVSEEFGRRLGTLLEDFRDEVLLPAYGDTEPAAVRAFHAVVAGGLRRYADVLDPQVG
jgi:hypothetical protein